MAWVSTKSAFAEYPELRSAWKLPDRIHRSSWAEKEIEVPPDSAQPGPYDLNWTPYIRAIIDCDSRFETVLKAQRTGLSLGFRSRIAHDCIDAPGNIGMVWPTKDLAEEAVENEFKRMFMVNPKLNQRLRSTRAGSEIRKFKISLANSYIQMAWASSLNTLVAKTLRYLYFEEPAEYENQKVDIFDFANLRTQTYGENARTIIYGHPRTEHDHMWLAWQAAPVKFFWHVCCTNCSAYQPVSWQQVKFGLPDDYLKTHGAKLAAQKVLLDGSAFYECKFCNHDLRDFDKADMNAVGIWAAEDALITEADIQAEFDLRSSVAKLTGDPPPYKYNQIVWKGLDRAAENHHIGFHVSSIYSPWTTFSQLANIFLNSLGHTGKLINFFSSYLGWLYRPKSSGVSRTIFHQKKQTAPPPRILPPWASYITSAADTQSGAAGESGYFYYVVRAWGNGYRSQLVDAGRVESFAELRARTLDTSFPNLDSEIAARQPDILLVDAGGAERFWEGAENIDDTSGRRINAVYEFSLLSDGRQDQRIMPIRGHGGRRRMPEQWTVRRIPYSAAQGKSRTIEYLRVNPDWNKDVLDGLVTSKPSRCEDCEGRGDECAACGGVGFMFPDDYWDVHSEISEDYVSQMTAERRTLFEGQYRWIPKETPANNHFWDCEYYAVAGAYFKSAALRPSHQSQFDEAHGRRRRQTVEAAQGERQGSDWISRQRRTWL